jgi:hypothetical protein
VDDVLVAHLTDVLAGMLSPVLLPFLTACGVGALLLRLFDELRGESTGRARLSWVFSVLVVATGLWAASLLPLATH